MRVNIARALCLDKGLVDFDEFTSVVNREVAKVSAFAISKAVPAADVLQRQLNRFFNLGRAIKRCILLVQSKNSQDYLVSDEILSAISTVFHIFTEDGSPLFSVPQHRQLKKCFAH
jgi:hypothetical protein